MSAITEVLGVPVLINDSDVIIKNINSHYDRKVEMETSHWEAKRAAWGEELNRSSQVSHKIKVEMLEIEREQWLANVRSGNNFDLLTASRIFS